MTACCMADFIVSTFGRKLFAVKRGLKGSTKLAVLEERKQRLLGQDFDFKQRFVVIAFERRGQGLRF
jgi:hypothetical protein